jgi:hypothetical protein
VAPGQILIHKYEYTTGTENIHGQASGTFRIWRRLDISEQGTRCFNKETGEFLSALGYSPEQDISLNTKYDTNDNPKGGVGRPFYLLVTPAISDHGRERKVFRKSTPIFPEVALSKVTLQLQWSLAVNLYRKVASELAREARSFGGIGLDPFDLELAKGDITVVKKAIGHLEGKDPNIVETLQVLRGFEQRLWGRLHYYSGE